MKREWPYVYVAKNGKGSVSKWWCDTGEKVKPRKRMSFSSKADAQAQADTWRAEFDDGGRLAFFTNDERLDAANALKQYRDAKVKDTLSAAVAYYLDHKYPYGQDIPLSDAVELFKDEKKDNKKNTVFYLWSLNRLDRLVEKFGTRKLSALTAREILAHIYTSKSLKHHIGNLWSPETQKQHFRYYRMFLDWCVENHHLAENPLGKKNVVAPTGNEWGPQVLYCDTIQKLLSRSWEQVVNAHQAGGKLNTDGWKQDDCDHRFFIYLALGIFAGIRPQELTRLDWSDLTLDCDWLHISEQVSKTHDKRHVALAYYLTLMLQEYRLKLMPEGINPGMIKILPGHYDSFKRKFRLWRAKVEPNHPWGHDCMRHTYATWFFFANDDMTALMSRMGHSQSYTTLNNYVNINAVKDRNWLDFWTLLPAECVEEPELDKTDPDKYKRQLLHLT